VGTLPIRLERLQHLADPHQIRGRLDLAVDPGVREHDRRSAGRFEGVSG